MRLQRATSKHISAEQQLFYTCSRQTLASQLREHGARCVRAEGRPRSAPSLDRQCLIQGRPAVLAHCERSPAFYPRTHVDSKTCSIGASCVSTGRAAATRGRPPPACHRGRGAAVEGCRICPPAETAERQARASKGGLPSASSAWGWVEHGWAGFAGARALRGAGTWGPLPTFEMPPPNPILRRL